ncbi:trans-sulfuration enzyme family protein [Microbacterium sp. No. 7]|uniref:trans-sulfuration enzyme family protein n=1 Tax=Microbacterium sp. No. 7 TaxID=1714373 RepID=UPI0006D29205|nr:PLP-dependent transferase [Microbacterium sp. No. 7]ALJ18644.1 cystathionine gamma-synthase [Microbacterium sp. No. 7]
MTHHADVSQLSPATRIVAAGREPRTPGGSVGAPLVLSSTYHAGGDVIYARVGNPTWTAFEEVLGSLEGGLATTFASGMAAVDAVLSLVPVGGVVVAPASAYNGVVATLDQRARAGELEVRFVDVTDTAQVIAACDGAHLVWLESPTNPLLDVADIPALTAAAHAAGALVACDNTFATPLLQRPLEDGVDVVVHSVTKYLAGHSDVIMGACVTADTEHGRALAARVLEHRSLRGAIPGPTETWLALRGIRTLALRVERACRNAAELAERLRRHPAVERVRYPGFGAMVSIDVAAGADAADRLCAATRVWVHSTSLGGVESQLERRRRIALEPETTPVSLVRLSVGIEDVEDLWADLAQALAGA